MAKQRKHLGEVIYRLGFVGKEALTDAIKTAQVKGKKLGDLLIETSLLTEDQLTEAIAKQHDMPYVDLDKTPITSDTLKLIPKDLIKKHNVLPLGEKNGRLQIAISDPLDLDTMDSLRFGLAREVDYSLGSLAKIKAYVDRKTDEVKTSIDKTVDELEVTGHTLEAAVKRVEAGGSQDDDGGMIKLVNLLIDEAVKMKASDIHVEPMTDRVRIRYRLDGNCMERDNIPKSMQAPLLARLKILAGMDMGERRLPQDGRIKRTIDGHDIDFRVSALPGYHGESVVLRILDPGSTSKGIQALGFGNEDYAKFQQMIKRPNGMFLVTGPTGSGKTTTLYSALQELNRPDKKIITAEDPVEYNFAGINQCQINSEIGLTFEKILRSMLRQSPNIILIGEIRDGIVADIAVQAALTGHLVFSTLHTNDAPSAVTRLIDMGVKPFLVASSIHAIMAQRLIRVICKECKAIDPNPDPQFLRLLSIKPEVVKDRPVYKGKGCARCNGSGYKGRIGIFEMMIMNNELRELTFNMTPSNLLRKAAKAGGMKTLLEDGRDKVFDGITTPEEVAGTTQEEGLLIDSE
jgi:type IV pilus assembly protein PilB